MIHLASGVAEAPEGRIAVSASQGSGPEPLGLLGLVRRLARLDGSSAGALCFEREPGTPEATVLIERGRVCWAVVAGARRRLREILVRRPDGPSDATLEEIVRECRESSRPFGETLVQRGLVSESVLRDALREHTCEALVRIAGERGLRARWVAHTRSKYDAQFTFAPLELLIGATRLGTVRARAEAADAALAELDGIGHASLVFDPDARAPGLPLASAGEVPCGIEELAPIARWASTTLAALAVPDDGVRAVILRADEDGAVIAGWRRELVVVSFVVSRRDVVLALSRLGR